MGSGIWWTLYVMVKQLSSEQVVFLKKVFLLTDISGSYQSARRVYFSTRLCGNGNRIDLVCERIINAGCYDTELPTDMEKLDYIRNWYIRTQLK